MERPSALPALRRSRERLPPPQGRSLGAEAQKDSILSPVLAGGGLGHSYTALSPALAVEALAYRRHSPLAPGSDLARRGCVVAEAMGQELRKGTPSDEVPKRMLLAASSWLNPVERLPLSSDYQPGSTPSAPPPQGCLQSASSRLTHTSGLGTSAQPSIIPNCFIASSAFLRLTSLALKPAQCFLGSD